MNYQKYSVAKKKAIELYEKMLLPRLIEEKMLLLLRQGKISKWFAGIGQEAISVGLTSALEAEEFIFPMHRNLGVFTSRDVPLHRLFAQWQGKMEGFTKGRDRSFHFGSTEHHIVGMISHLGPQLSLACGVALANKLKKNKQISLAITGEGGTSEGEFHEALNVAAVWQLPVIFVIENNGYALSTPTKEQYRCEKLSDRAKGYGMKSINLNGNNILEVYSQISKIAKKIRTSPEPWLVECHTFRIRGHEEASGTKYVPQQLIVDWKEMDPISNYEDFLLGKNWITNEGIEDKRKQIKSTIDAELAMASAFENIVFDKEMEYQDVFAVKDFQHTAPAIETKKIRFIDAISEGLNESMQRYDELVMMGQDVAEYGGVFKITKGFVEKYGSGRVRNTPLCESAILGIGLGLSIAGMKAMVEMQFADFVTCGFNQIVNNLAKLHYRWGQNADVVIRMPTGGGVGAGPFHSQSNEAWFFHVPGLKIAYPSNPEDAKGLLISAFEDPNPVLFFEHKALYRSISNDVPEGYYNLPFGKACLEIEGKDLSIICYGMAVHWAKEICIGENIDADILDLRTLCPLDYEAIHKSVKKTNKVLIVHEDNLIGGIAAELSAYISEFLFEFLDGPVMRVASEDTPIPFNSELEKNYLAKSKLKNQINKLINY